jgi:hypothetical protein
MILKITNNSGGTVAGVTNGGAKYINLVAIICDANGTITKFKEQYSSSFISLPSGHTAQLGELGSNQAFATTLTSVA